MDNEFTRVIVAFLPLLLTAGWWFTARAPYRRYILFAGISWSLTIVSYIIAMSFDILVFGIIVIIAFFSTLYFLIRAARAEYRTKHS